MTMKKILLAAAVFAGSLTAVSAQQAAAPVPPAVQAAIDEAAAVCQATPADCAAAMQTVLAAMQAAGLSGAALDNALVALASTLTSIGSSLPPALQGEIASALQVVASNLSPGNALLETLNEIVAALDAGAGENVVAVLSSPN